MLPTMETILNALLNQLTTAPARTICEGMGAALLGQWSWSYYVKYLCYQGLQQTTEFGTLFQPVYNTQNQITSGNELYQNYFDYTNIGHDNLDRTIP